MRQCLIIISLRKSYLNNEREAFPEMKNPRAARGLGTSKTAKTFP